MAVHKIKYDGKARGETIIKNILEILDDQEKRIKDIYPAFKTKEIWRSRKNHPEKITQEEIAMSAQLLNVSIEMLESENKYHQEVA